MQNFTKQRILTTQDEIWFLEHYPVFTQGTAGKDEHILENITNIKVIRTDRGGQVTYHGPGQLIVYFLLNLSNNKLTLKKLITILSKSIIELLDYYNIIGYTKEHAPGVYVNDNKICSIGLKLSRGCTYHGLSLNIDMDLQPFKQINPCGYTNLKMTQLSDFISKNIININFISQQLQKILINNFNN